MSENVSLPPIPAAKLTHMGSRQVSYRSPRHWFRLGGPWWGRVAQARRFSGMLLVGLLTASLGAISLAPPSPAEANEINPSTTSTTIKRILKNTAIEKTSGISTVNITEMTPIVTPDTPKFSLRAQVQLATGTDFVADVSLKIATRTPVTRKELAAWAVGETRKTALETVATSKNVHFSGEQTQELKFEVSREDLPLGRSSEWGPRFLELSITPKSPIKNTDKHSRKAVKTQTKDSSSAVPPFSARSFLLWDSGAAFEPSQLLVLMPVVVTSRDVEQSGQVLPDFATTPTPRHQKLCELAHRTPLTPVFDPLLMNPKSKTFVTTRRLLQLKDPEPSVNSNHVNPETANSQDKNPGETPSHSLPLVTALAQGHCGTRPPAYLPPGDFAAGNTAWLNHRQAPATGTPFRQQDAIPVTSNRALVSAAQRLATRLDVAPALTNWRENLILWPQELDSPTPDLAAEVATWGTNAPLVLEAKREYLETPKPATYQSDARHEIEINPDTTTLGWVADRELSDLLNADWMQLGFDLDFTNNLEAVPATTKALVLRQWALAATAVLTRERPFAPRLFVAGTARDFAATPEQTAVIEALAGARWLQFPSWQDTRPDNRSHIQLPTTPPPRESEFSALSNGDNTGQAIYSNPALNLTENLARGASLESVLEKSAEFREVFEELQVRSMCATCENSFPDGKFSPGKRLEPTRQPPGAGDGYPADHPRALIDPDVSQKLLNLVKAQPASVINLIDKEAKIPISVTNSYNTPVSVRVRLKAADPRLQFPAAPKLQVPANSTALTRIPVKAVGHGDITVQVALTNAAGQEVGQREEIQLRVRAQWESTGVYVLAGILAIVLVGGITRRIIKSRKLKRENHERH